MNNDNQLFDLKPNKFIGIQKINRFKIGLLDECILPFPCSINTIAYFNLKTEKIDYFFLNENDTIDKLYVFSNANLILIEKISQKKTLCSIRENKLSELVELNKKLIDIDIRNNLMCLLTQCECFIYLSLWNLNENFSEISKIDLSIDLEKFSISKVAFHPKNTRKLLLYGNKLLQEFCLKDNKLVLDWKYSSDECFLSHVWLNEQILIGTSSGNLLIFDDEGNNLKKIEIHPNKKLEHILNVSNGFVSSNGTKFLSVFKNTSSGFELHHTFELTRLNEDSETGYPKASLLLIGINIEEFSINLTINQNETHLVVLTNLNRIYYIELNKELNINESNSKQVKDFHCSKIISSDVCLQKNLVFTCCLNRSLKMWNFTTGELELSKYFDESILGASLHPSGFYLAMCFYSKIDFFIILNNQLILNKSFKYHANDCKFSNAGHLIGLISNTCIDIYNIWNYENLSELKFRNGKLTHFEWFNQDQLIAATTNMGIICIWNVISGEKLVEYSEKTIQFTLLEVYLTSQDLILFAFDHLNNLRLLKANLIKNANNNLENINLVFENYLFEPNTRKRTMNEKTKLQITCFTYYKNLIIVGSDKGHILIKDYLLSDNDNNNEKRFQYHNSSICQLKLIRNSSKIKLISCSVDGLIVISDLINNLCNPLSSEIAVAYSDDILQTRNEIRKKHNYDLNLQLNLIEKNEDQAYQVRLRELEQKEQTKTINYEAKLELTRLRTKLKEIKLNEEKKLEFYKRRLENLRNKFEKDLELVKQAAENELSKQYEMQLNLTSKHDNLLSLMSALHDELISMTRPETLNKFSNEVVVYKQYKMYDMKQEIRTNLFGMNRKIAILKRENNLIELEGDNLLEEFKLKNTLVLNEIEQKNESVRTEISLVKKQLKNINSELKQIKQDEIDFDSNLLNIRKKYLTKLEFVENFKKSLNLINHELASKEKTEQQLKIQLEQLKKYKYINEYRLKELNTSLDPLLKENDDLKEDMLTNQNHLEHIIAPRINYLNSSRANLFHLKSKIDKKLQTAKSKLNYVTNFHFRLNRINADLQDLVLKPNNLIELYSKFKSTIENKYFE